VPVEKDIWGNEEHEDLNNGIFGNNNSLVNKKNTGSKEKSPKSEDNSIMEFKFG
jgi:hypothetical protein